MKKINDFIIIIITPYYNSSTRFADPAFSLDHVAGILSRLRLHPKKKPRSAIFHKFSHRKTLPIVWHVLSLMINY